VNLAVIAHHQPRVIIHTGFEELTAIKRVYGLKEQTGPVMRPSHPTHTLLRHFEMPDGTPWLSIKHPSSWGFSNEDIGAISAYALEHRRPR
jgi:hypothetical protein